MTSCEFRAGLRVRLKSNPSRTGVLTGSVSGSSASPRWQVVFTDRTEHVPGLALEPVLEEGNDPFDDLRRLRFGTPRELRSGLTHARLGGRLADLIYCLNTTNTEFYAHQFKPVLSFLDSPSRGLLIADEVGLGKTIEAGLIWTELRSRENARRLLVLCPAMLREKWRMELADRFGVEATLCSAEETVDVLERAAGNQRAEFAIIASMQGLRGLCDGSDEEVGTPGARFTLLAEDSAGDGAPIDLVVIDEAHYMRNPETRTAKLGRMLRGMTENLVLLSATPVHLRSDDLFHLLNLVDPDSFPHVWSFDLALRENAPLIELRDLLLSSDYDPDAVLAAIKALEGSQLSMRSEALRFVIESPPDETSLGSPGTRLALAERIDRINPITKVVCRTRKRDVQERRVVREPSPVRVDMNEVEERFYLEVTAAVRRYCRDLEQAQGFLLTVPQRQMCSSMAAACRAWSRRSSELDDEIDRILFEAFGTDGDEEVSTRRSPKSAGLVAELARIAGQAGDFEMLRRHDSKFDGLRDHLLEYWRRNAGAKVVLFAYFRDTLTYLAERFAELGVDSEVLMGGMDKKAALARFARPDGPRLLLASEVASEGIDLQFSSLLVNYDLPWNPMRIEQRIGRIDRIGQKADRIVILNVMQGGTLDERVYVKLLQRLKIFERALGSMEGVLGDEIRRMSFELLRHDLTPEEEDAVIRQTRMAVEQRSRMEEQLEEDSGRLVAHGDYLQQRINSARSLNRWVSTEDLFAYVSDFLDERCSGAQLVRVDDADTPVWEIDLGPAARADFADYLERERLQGRTTLASSSSGRRRCVFENLLRRSRADAESISQYHPLVSWIRHRLEAEEAHRHAAVAALRVSAADVPGLPVGIHVFAVARWCISGELETERLAFEASTIGAEQPPDPESAERIITNAALRGLPWFEVRGALAGDEVGRLFEAVMDRLDERYVGVTADAERENRDRIGYQLEQIDRNEEREICRLMGLIARLRADGRMRTIRANEGRIVKVRERAAERRARLAKRRDLRHESMLVCCGVVLVE